MLDLEALNIQITAESFQAIGALDRLIEKLREVKTTMGGLRSTKIIKTNISTAEGNANTVKASASQVKATAEANENLSDALSAVSRVEGAVSKSTEEMGDAIAYAGTRANDTKQHLGVLGNSISRVQHRSNGLMHTIKRVATMRVIRWALREAVASAREGLEILVEWDRTYGNNTSYAAKTVDELSAKWREVKKSIGAAIMPIIQLMQPALTAVMNAVIAIANAINQVVRGIQGYSDYMKATYNYTKSTVGAAKELRRILFGFDELNVLPSENGSGGGITASAIEFEPTGIEEKWLHLGKTIREVWDNLRKRLDPALEGIRKAFGGFTKILDGIVVGDWGLVWEGAKEVVGGAKDFFVESWNLAWASFKEIFSPLVEWVNEKILNPLGAAVDGFLARHPILEKIFKFFGGEGGKIEGKININATSTLDTNTHKISVLDDESKKGAIKIGFKTDTYLSPDTRRLYELLGKTGTTLLDIGASIAIGAGGFATGGDPVTGSLFFAGENGAQEIVANTSGGTGVMNVKQMQDAVSNGNVQVVNAIGAMANRVVGAINSKDTNAYLDGQKITDTVIRRVNGMARATGQPVIAR